MDLIRIKNLKLFNSKEHDSLIKLINAREYKLAFSFVRSKYSLEDTKYYLYCALRHNTTRKYETREMYDNKGLKALYDFQENGLLRILKSNPLFIKTYTWDGKELI